MALFAAKTVLSDTENHCIIVIIDKAYLNVPYIYVHTGVRLIRFCVERLRGLAAYRDALVSCGPVKVYQSCCLQNAYLKKVDCVSTPLLTAANRWLRFMLGYFVMVFYEGY